MHINPLNAELNPICHLLALLGAHHILHISRVRVKKSFIFLVPKHRDICESYKVSVNVYIYLRANISIAIVTERHKPFCSV